MPRRPGIVSPAQLSTLVPPPVHLARDYLRSEVSARLRAGTWQQIRPGAYLETSPDVDDYTRRRLEALALARALDAKLTGKFVFSHQTAATLHGLPLVTGHATAHLTQRFTSGGRDAKDVRRHVTRLPLAHRTTVHGMPTTTLERTIVDCAMTLSRLDALIIADAGLHTGADLDECHRIAASLAGQRGIRAARWVLGHADDGAESAGETRTRFTVLRAGLPRPVTQVRVATRDGIYWCDIGWPELRVGLEYDGVAKYGRDGASTREALLAEKRRQDAIEEAGWTLLRVMSADLRDGSLVHRARAAHQRSAKK